MEHVQWADITNKSELICDCCGAVIESGKVFFTNSRRLDTVVCSSRCGNVVESWKAHGTEDTDCNCRDCEISLILH